MIDNKLTVAVQKSGRLREGSIKFLELEGYNLPEDDGLLLSSNVNADVNILSVRDDDIPEYVFRDVADMGIVGENVLAEKCINLKPVKRLGFAFCSLVIAVPENSDIKSIEELEGLRIATSYPNLLRSFLQRNSVSASVVTLAGSVEVAPALNLSDAICDLTQSGRTLKENNLITIATIFESQAVLISNLKNENTKC